MQVRCKPLDLRTIRPTVDLYRCNDRVNSSRSCQKNRFFLAHLSLVLLTRTPDAVFITAAVYTLSFWCTWNFPDPAFLAYVGQKLTLLVVNRTAAVWLPLLLSGLLQLMVALNSLNFYCSGLFIKDVYRQRLRRQFLLMIIADLRVTISMSGQN